MHTTISLPFGISLRLTPHNAVVTASRLEREFYVPTDDLGSKAESARIALEEACYRSRYMRSSVHVRFRC